MSGKPLHGAPPKKASTSRLPMQARSRNFRPVSSATLLHMATVCAKLSLWAAPMACATRFVPAPPATLDHLLYRAPPIRLRRVSSAGGKRRGCIRIRTGSVSTSPNGTGFIATKTLVTALCRWAMTFLGTPNMAAASAIDIDLNRRFAAHRFRSIREKHTELLLRARTHRIGSSQFAFQTIQKSGRRVVCLVIHNLNAGRHRRCAAAWF